MKTKVIFFLAIKAILLNKSRSFLTMLGVIIGVCSVVLLTSIGNGLQFYITDQFNDLGANLIYVMPGSPFGEGGGMGGEQAIISTTQPILKKEQFTKIMRQNRALIKNGSITTYALAKAKTNLTSKQVMVYGVYESFAQLYNFPATRGRWFSKQENEQAERVVVLGSEAATEFFGNIDPINKKIQLNGQSYRILGVLGDKGGSFGGPNFDNYIYLPAESLLKFFDTDLIDSFMFEIRQKEQIPEAIAAIKKFMSVNEKLEDDEFSVFDQTQLLTTINSILGVLTLGLGGISAISLVVGGIGIMNIMLVSVSERTREIGLRKALGATPNLIMLQFLFEAALLSVIGGLIGLLLAYGGSLLMQAYFPARVTSDSVILAFGISLAVGLVFGVAPARAAAKLSPIEALRYE